MYIGWTNHPNSRKYLINKMRDTKGYFLTNTEIYETKEDDNVAAAIVDQ
jgi:hypothetical protein